jgi:nucleoside 2-deoxyribosyltransferase
MKMLKVFFAGKVDPLSPHAAPFWRSEIAWQLNHSLKHYQVVDSSLVHQRNQVIVENNLPASVLFSQSCFYIRHSDILVVNLTDDISVGGSQEIFIAKQFGIPVIGMARRGGKFNRLKYELNGRTYWNWLHPFVSGLCDLVVNGTEELASALDSFETIPAGGLNSIESAVNHYQRNASALDTTVNRILSYRGEALTAKQKLRVYFAGKMGKASGFSETAWRDQFSATISRSSRFRAINLDFLEASHDAVNENDGKLIFGRDAYLIRSSDVVVVNLSDDISIGGSVEMMLAKLYHRPLIGIAHQGGKFVKPEKYMFGGRLTSYVNPFVAATCDWLISDPAQLPEVIDKLFTINVKTNYIVPASVAWYAQNLLRADKAAQQVFATA